MAHLIENRSHNTQPIDARSINAEPSTKSAVASRRADVERNLGREDREILRLLVECSNDEAIARRLAVSVRTVRRRIARIMILLRAENRFAAGVAAATLELLDFPCSEASAEVITPARPAPATRAHRTAAPTLRILRT